LFLFNKRDTYPLIIPAAFILLSALLVWQWPGLEKQVGKMKEMRALLTVLPYLPYVFLTIGFVMGWRFNNGGMILTTFILGLSYFALSHTLSGSSSKVNIGPSIPESMSFLLPLNLAYFATLRNRHILTPKGLSCIGFILFQAFGVVLLCYPQLITNAKGSFSLPSKSLLQLSVKLGAVFHGGSFWGIKNVSTISFSSFLAAFMFLLMRFHRSRDSLSAGSLCTLVAVLLGIALYTKNSLTLFFSAAGLILVITSIETSFSMAYIDELTELPGRRSLNETLANLGRRYAIAMIDIDHFKKFNDQYGHKTGDQVLKMVASNLKELTGGAKVFRYGGEEFAAVFSGKTAKEVVPHLDTYRKILESTPFTVRGRGRKKSSAENRGKISPASRKGINVTVSIGVASPNRGMATPEKVLKAADRILYKAKKAGRNRVLT
jgi:diguanylate cyclase (GGDEF)-like protein